MKLLKELLDRSEQPQRLHVGMRIVKSVVAVYLCALLGCIEGRSAYFAMLSSLRCMQSTSEGVVRVAFFRVVGSAIGTMYALLIISLDMLFKMSNCLPIYYLLVSLTIIPVFLTALQLRLREATYLSAVIFLSISVLHINDPSPYIYAIQRFLDNVFGILISVAVNMILPGPTKKE